MHPYGQCSVATTNTHKEEGGRAVTTSVLASIPILTGLANSKFESIQVPDHLWIAGQTCSIAIFTPLYKCAVDNRQSSETGSPRGMMEHGD